MRYALPGQTLAPQSSLSEHSRLILRRLFPRRASWRGRVLSSLRLDPIVIPKFQERLP